MFMLMILFSNVNDGFDVCEKYVFYQFEQKLMLLIMLISCVQYVDDMFGLYQYMFNVGLVYNIGVVCDNLNGIVIFKLSWMRIVQIEMFGDYYVCMFFNIGDIDYKFVVGLNYDNFSYV